MRQHPRQCGRKNIHHNVRQSTQLKDRKNVYLHRDTQQIAHKHTFNRDLVVHRGQKNTSSFYSLKSNIYTLKVPGMTQYTPQKDAATPPFIISKDLCWDLTRKTMPALPDKQQKQLHRDTNVRLIMFPTNRGFHGLRIDALKHKARIHLLIDNANCMGVQGSGHRILTSSGLLCVDRRPKKGHKGGGEQKKRKAFSPQRLSASKIQAILKPTPPSRFRVGGRGSQLQKKINACLQPYPGARLRLTYCTPSPRHGTLRSGCWMQRPSARHGMCHNICPYRGKPW